MTHSPTSDTCHCGSDGCRCTGKQARLNTLSVVSIASTASYFGAVAGIITGHVALNQVKDGGRGRRLALAGVIGGYAIVASWILLIVASVLVKLAFVAGLLGGSYHHDVYYPQPQPLPYPVQEDPYIFADPYFGPDGGFIQDGEPYFGPHGGFIDIGPDPSVDPNVRVTVGA